MTFLIKECDSVSVRIYIAGDIGLIKNACREFVMSGLCVNITETDYIYTMGSETGACVELINYPRFPTTEEELFNKGITLAKFLLDKCFQGSCSVVSKSRTIWITRRSEDFK